MANRRCTDNSQRKVTDNTPRPAVSHAAGPKPMYGATTDPPYNADIGLGGPDMNRGAGFPHVRVYMKSKQSPMIGGGGVLSPSQSDPASVGQATSSSPLAPVGGMDGTVPGVGAAQPMVRRRGLL